MIDPEWWVWVLLALGFIAMGTGIAYLDVWFQDRQDAKDPKTCLYRGYRIKLLFQGSGSAGQTHAEVSQRIGWNHAVQYALSDNDTDPDIALAKAKMNIDLRLEKLAIFEEFVCE